MSPDERTILENDLTDTETLFNCVAITDFLILESLYKLLFFSRVVPVGGVAAALRADRVVAGGLKTIKSSVKFSGIFSRIAAFMGVGEIDGLVETIFRSRMESLKHQFTDISLLHDGTIRWYGTSGDTESYFHGVYNLVRYLQERDRMFRDGEKAVKGMVNMLGNLGGGDGGHFKGMEDLAGIFGGAKQPPLTTESGKSIFGADDAVGVIGEEEEGEEDVEIDDDDDKDLPSTG